MPIHRRTAVALVAALLACFAVAPASAGQDEPRAQRQPTQNTMPAPTPTPTPTGPEASAWAWPLALPHPVLREFRAPVSEYAAGHRGIDVAAHPGDPVFAVADGTVTFAGIVVDRSAIALAHDGGLVSSIEPVTALVAPGDSVQRGQLIGRVATGGHCGDACVHLGARISGRYVSPMRYLGGVPRAVLLPTESAALLRRRDASLRSPVEQELWHAVVQDDGLQTGGPQDGLLRGAELRGGGAQARGWAFW